MSASALSEERLVEIATGVTLGVSEFGDPAADPLVMICGTTISQGMWGELRAALAGRHRLICYDHRGMGQSTRGEGEITMAAMAEDLAALLDALEVPRAHVLGWSLGSAVGQELAIAHPEKVAGLVLWGTWARGDGFQRAVLAGLEHPWTTGDMEAALTALGIAFSPELLDSPQFAELMGQLLPLFPKTPLQIATTREQWRADEAHDTLDRLSQISAPTLVVAGEQDLLTPHWLGKRVAEAIPGARYELYTGPGSSHALGMERAEEFVPLVLGFLAENHIGAAV
jgi:pimeloyl-ACP methyl ester carboxylesterase